MVLKSQTVLKGLHDCVTCELNFVGCCWFCYSGPISPPVPSPHGKCLNHGTPKNPCSFLKNPIDFALAILEDKRHLEIPDIQISC